MINIPYESYNIIYEPIESKHIKQYGNDRFNTNNHFINDTKPDDYFLSIEKSQIFSL